MAEIDDTAATNPADRLPDPLAGPFVVPDDFDEFSAEDEALWYGGKDDLLTVEDPFADYS